MITTVVTTPRGVPKTVPIIIPNKLKLVILKPVAISDAVSTDVVTVSVVVMKQEGEGASGSRSEVLVSEA